MEASVIFTYPGCEYISGKIITNPNFMPGDITIRKFPDKENYLKLNSDVAERDVIFVCGLDNPDLKVTNILFFSKLVKEYGAKSIGLVAPYLGYMRQDKRFNPGEAVTSKIFAEFISQHVDWLATVDPHMHRYKSLQEIYTIPTKIIHATNSIATWIGKNVQNPFIVGPDEESIQWVSDVATKINAPFTVLTKTRRGDNDVEVSIPNIRTYADYKPILLDDIISTANTMLKAVEQLQKLSLSPPICIAVHAIFANNAYESLKSAYVDKVITCNTIFHESNLIDLSQDIIQMLYTK